MDEYRKNAKKVQKALNQDAAFIQPNPYLAQRVLNAANKEGVGKGRLTVRRKFSMSFVLILVLVLFALTAVAAVILSGKDFVAEYVAPLSGNTDSETWSYDELQYIKKIATENGVPLTDEILSELETTDEVFKETLMRLFMKMELGDFPASWPIAEQAWFDELLFNYGLIDERTRFVPTEGEISEETALNIARQYMKDTWKIDLSDVSSYKRYVQYMLSVNANGEKQRIWDISFEFPDGYTYAICISSDGKVSDNPYETKVYEPDSKASQRDNRPALPEDIIDLARLMRDDSFYNVYTLASFKDNYGTLINSIDDKSFHALFIMQQLLNIPYAEPDENDIKPEEAIDIAKKWALANGWTDEWLGWCKFSVSYRIYDEEQPTYRVCFNLRFENREVFYRREMPFGFVVYINPENGSVLESITLIELDDFEPYCEFPDPHDTAVDPGNG